MLKLMYITNNPLIAQLAEEAGVDWIFVDMEFIGKNKRQGGLNTVQNHHSIEDIICIKRAIKKAKVIVRINPIHDATSDYFSSEEEINASIKAGADILMLPFFHTCYEVSRFINLVDGRVKTCLLLETPEAASNIDKILEIKGIDMIHLGLNDLHLALGMKFMFELLANGTVDNICAKIKAKGIPFGFGGIASLNNGAVPGSLILKEHYRIGSSMVIVSRSFCNTDGITVNDDIREKFINGISEIRTLEKKIIRVLNYFESNRIKVIKSVNEIIKNK